MEIRRTYGFGSRSLAYILLVTVVLGQCCLLVSEAFADAGHHRHGASAMSSAMPMEHGAFLEAVSVDVTASDCCHEDMARVSTTSIPKPTDIAVPVTQAALPLVASLRTTDTNRAPPPRLSSECVHALLQIYLI